MKDIKILGVDIAKDVFNCVELMSGVK
uniref:Truncated IS1111A transposase n=1 Tax=Coxiella burnetii TaxID=777 RepID=Q06HE8_COXBE|nr:truncated IS1111A transposase [Coxiella burnetii]ABI95922.1 truncated IS1111A transposase [Coxiella burnetii]ABI95941.1 truncated IS1111A transposase [Coxiella burnetii]ABI95950.1 truncated IS1111A transposase [Coxiella burnetii]ABI95965.1 truncated IS1111A transposase [Coxiella burnetii]